MTVPGNQRSIDRLPPAYRLYQWAWAGLDWLYPPFCGGCGKPGTRWCADCQAAISLILPPVCSRCGQKWSNNEPCLECQTIERPYRAIRSWAFYTGPLRTAILRLKYKGELTLGDVLAQPILHMLKNLAWDLDLVVPVPIAPSRLVKRGYNQAALLAWPIALGGKLAYHRTALAKIRQSRSQVGLSVAERFQNVAGAFQADPRIVAGRSILVVDDVMTSGATLEACATALVQAGAAQIYGVTLARAGSVEDHRLDIRFERAHQASAEPG